MKNAVGPVKRIVIKVGTKVLTNRQGVISPAALARIVTQIAMLKQAGHQVILVSSGAMGAGKSLMKVTRPLTELSEKQLYSAIGQAQLIHSYGQLLEKHDLICAQVLATKEDFRDKSHFYNMRNCLEALLHDNVLPIMNENDVVALDELTFTDNDELAGLVASMLNADLLIILSSIDGLLDTSQTPTQVIPSIDASEVQFFESFVGSDKSEAGRGGMTTKYKIARRLAKQGIEVVIANGTRPDTVTRILAGEPIGTHFLPGKRLSNVRRLVAHSDDLIKGSVTINDCAVDTLLDDSQVASLLFVGVTHIDGDFERGDIIEILGPDKVRIGYGVSQYVAEEAEQRVGQKNVRPLIHYDYLFIE